MKIKVSIFLFDEHIADMYQDGDRVYLKTLSNNTHKASPLNISSGLYERETTHLTFLDRVAGFISDSLPGNFGNEILDNFFNDTRGRYPTVSDKLLFIGNKGLGAITFQPSIEEDSYPDDTIELRDMFEEAKRLKKGGEYHAIHNSFLVSAHSFVGGARSKAVGAINLKNNMVFLGDRTKPLGKDYIHAIIKYDDTAEGDENKSTYSKVEYIYYLLAKECGINMSFCTLVESKGKHHFITKRFDIENSGKKYHVHSLAGLLEVDYNIPRELGYEDLLRTAVKLEALDSLDQLMLQMLFNYMFVNQDDHTRNFSFMCDKDFKWKATPAYDLTFAKGKKQTVEHQLSLYAKPLSLIDVEDVVKLVDEFSIELEFVVNAIKKMKKLREDKLPQLLKEYDVDNKKAKQIIEETYKRDFEGAI